MSALREIVAWLGLLPSVTGAILCAIHLGRSRWVAVLLGGFVVQTALSAFYRVATSFLGGGIPMSSGGVGLVLLAASMLALVANAAIVGGVAGLLYELNRDGRSGRVVSSPTA